MKHLKLYEDLNNEFWLVTYTDHQEGYNYSKLFVDRESAENYYIVSVNGLKEDSFIRKNKEYTLSNKIGSFETAEKWMEDIGCFDHNIQINEISPIKYKLPKELKMLGDSEKYNL